MQSFLLEIFLSGMIVDVFLITKNLRSTAAQQNHAKPLYDPKFWSYKERERERERERLKRSAHIAMQFLVGSHRYCSGVIFASARIYTSASMGQLFGAF